MDKGMFAQIKLYIYGAIAGFIAILYGWGKYQSSKKEEAQEEVESLKKEVESKKEEINLAYDISDINNKYKEKASKDENTKVDRTVGNFSDNSLLDD